MLKLDAIYYGDSATLVIPLTLEGAAFSPGVEYGLIWTAKEKLSDPDAAAMIQKSDEAGITVTGSNARIGLVRGDTVGLVVRQLVWDVVATHTVTGERHTVAAGTLPFVRGATRLAEVSVPIYTTHPAITLHTANMIASATTDETPQDTDQFAFNRPGVANSLKKITGAGIKAWLKGYFDTLYQAIGSVVTWSSLSGKPAAFPPEAHAASHGALGGDPVTPAGIGAVAAADAVVGIGSASDSGKVAKYGTYGELRAYGFRSLEDGTNGFLGTVSGGWVRVGPDGGVINITIPDPGVSAYTITFPAATGTLALTSQITGTNSGTNTGDETEASIVSKLSGNGITIAGSKTLSGQLELTNQSVVSTNSTMTSGILKQKEVYLAELTADGTAVTASTAFTDTGLSLTLPAGRYMLSCMLNIVSTGGTGGGWGFKVLATGGTASNAIRHEWGVKDWGSRNFVAAACGFDMTSASSNSGYFGGVDGIVSLSATTTLAIQHRMFSADAGISKTPKAGSFFKAVRLS